MQKVDYIIVGLGWAGAMVAYELVKRGFTVSIYDNEYPFAATPNTAAIINPISGKKRNVSTNFDANFKVAQAYYTALANDFGQQFLYSKPILLLNEDDGHSSNIYENPYFSTLNATELNIVEQTFILEKSAKLKINNSYLVDAKLLMKNIKQFLNVNAIIHLSDFDTTQMIWHPNTVQYENLLANKIIFTRGALEQKDNLMDSNRFTPNRGDHLTVMIPELAEPYIYDIGMRLVPLGNHVFWMGSNNIWDINSVALNLDFRSHATQLLKKTLKFPYQILEYNIGFRPTTPGQKVIIEQSQEKPLAYFFNGLGTRGFSTGPYYLQQFLKLLLD